MEALRNGRKHKVTLVGSSNVGKTSLVRWFYNKTAAINPVMTVAADWIQASVTVDNKEVNLQIWDTAGQERYRSLLPMYIRASSGVLLMYDVTDKESFTSLTAWLDVVRTNIPAAVIKLIANKVDLPERIISTEEGENFARENGLEYAETSATTGHNIDDVFNDLAKQIVDRWTGSANNMGEHIQLENDVMQKRTNCGC